MEQIIRTQTGIEELDKALNGGIPEGNVVLVAGGAGTGKSTLCLQIAINNTLAGNKALYLSTEQDREELYKQANGFNWNLADLEKRQVFKLVYFDVTEGDSFLEKIHALIQDFTPKIIIIDSLTTLTDSMLVSGVLEDKGFSMVQIAETINPIPRTEQIISKTLLYHLFKDIKKHDVTTLMTTELPEDHKQLSADGVSEFIADGVLLFRSLNVGGTLNRSVEIRKMRYTPIDSSIHSYQLIETGIIVE
jgi:circadian clock protein KaiC